jgi:hypothetical protein
VFIAINLLQAILKQNERKGQKKNAAGKKFKYKN